MKNPSIASINDPVNVNILDGVLEVYFLGSALKPGRSSVGMLLLFPPLPINKSACVHIHPRERVHFYPSLVLRDLKHLSKAYI